MTKAFRNKIIEIFTIITLASTAVTGGAAFLWNYFAVPQIEDLIKKQLNIAHDNKKGSLSSNIAKSLKIERDMVAPVIISVIKSSRTTQDSIRSFVDEFFPAIVKDHSYIDIGLKKDRRTGVIYYLANDSVMYQAIANEEGKYYYTKGGGWLECQ